MAVSFLGDQLKAFGQIFSGKIKAKDSLGSVFSIATMFDTGWDWRVLEYYCQFIDFTCFLQFTAYPCIGWWICSISYMGSDHR